MCYMIAECWSVWGDMWCSAPSISSQHKQKMFSRRHSIIIIIQQLHQQYSKKYLRVIMLMIADHQCLMLRQILYWRLCGVELTCEQRHPYYVVMHNIFMPVFMCLTHDRLREMRVACALQEFVFVSTKWNLKEIVIIYNGMFGTRVIDAFDLHFQLYACYMLNHS